MSYFFHFLCLICQEKTKPKQLKAYFQVSIMTLVLLSCFSHGDILLNCYPACFRLVAILVKLWTWKIPILGKDPKGSLATTSQWDSCQKISLQPPHTMRINLYVFNEDFAMAMNFLYLEVKKINQIVCRQIKKNA